MTDTDNPDYKQAAEKLANTIAHFVNGQMFDKQIEKLIIDASAPLLEQNEKQQAQIKELTAEFDKVIMGNINYGALRLELQSMKTELKKVEEWESVKEVDRLKRELITKQEEINKNKEAYDLAMSFEKAGWYKSDEFEKLTEQIEKLKEENESLKGHKPKEIFLGEIFKIAGVEYFASTDCQGRNFGFARTDGKEMYSPNATNRTLVEEAFNAGRSTVIPTKQLQMVISFDFKDFEQWDKMRQGQATSELEKLKR